MKEIIYLKEIDLLCSLLETEELKQIERMRTIEDKQSLLYDSIKAYRGFIYQLEQKLKRIQNEQKTQYQIVEVQK